MVDRVHRVPGPDQYECERDTRKESPRRLNETSRDRLLKRSLRAIGREVRRLATGADYRAKDRELGDRTGHRRAPEK